MNHGKMQRSFIVTGAGGFIGARFVEAVRRTGARVISVDRVSDAASAFGRPEHHGLDFGKMIDIEDLEGFLERMSDSHDARESPRDITAVIHLGACTDTMNFDEAVHEKLNVAYSKMLWIWCTKNHVPLIYASCAASYGAGQECYVDEEAPRPPVEPFNPYGWSKQRVDRWTLEEERQGRAPPRWAGFKFFNVYGFGERHKARMASVVLHAFDQIRDRGQVRLFKSYRQGFGDGEQKRDFVYVEDVVDVLVHGATGDLKRGIFNLGSGKARTFVDLATATFRALGREPVIEYIDMPVELRDRYQYFTEAKLDRLRAGGYTMPFTSLEDGVHRYVQRLLAHGSAAMSSP